MKKVLLKLTGNVLSKSEMKNLRGGDGGNPAESWEDDGTGDGGSKSKCKCNPSQDTRTSCTQSGSHASINCSYNVGGQTYTYGQTAYDCTC